jgi:hypothetical protein
MTRAGRQARTGAALFGLALLTLAAPGRTRGSVEPPTLDTPAARYAAMDAPACEAALAERGVPFSPVDRARGVLAPVRLTGAVRGVWFHSVLPASQRETTPYEILDCRLALALDDFAALLARRGIVEVVHLSLYRPPARSFPDGRIGGQHGGGLAIDASQFRKSDGTLLDVDRDFDGRIGDTTCGKSAVEPRGVPSAELRSIVCEAAEQHLFQVELTPDYNRKHKNHFHLEVTANVRWFFVR